MLQISFYNFFYLCILNAYNIQTNTKINYTNNYNFTYSSSLYIYMISCCPMQTKCCRNFPHHTKCWAGLPKIKKVEKSETDILFKFSSERWLTLWQLLHIIIVQWNAAAQWNTTSSVHFRHYDTALCSTNLYRNPDMQNVNWHGFYSIL
jgi:hypothetical protein